MHDFKMSCAAGKIKFPFEIIDLDAALNDELLKFYKGGRDGFVQVGPERYFFPQKYKTEAELYYNFEARPDDVWVVTFPRSGTTWMQELVWLVANNLNFDIAKSRPLTERFPFFEFALLLHDDLKAELLKLNSGDAEKLKFIEEFSIPGYEALNNIPTNQRRFIKTHFPFSLLPPSVLQQKCKIIYVARNPKDVAVSYYHLNRLFRTLDYVGDFERFWKYFEQGLNHWLPYHSHINEALAKQHLPNVLFLNYEDMVKDLGVVIDKVATFLNCPLSGEGKENLLNHLNITNLRLNPSVNMQDMEEIGILNKRKEGFVRIGGRGIQPEFAQNPKLIEKADKWVENNKNVIVK